MTNILTDLIDETLKEVNLSLKESKKLKKEAEISAGPENTMFSIKVSVSNPQSETKLGLRIQLKPKEGFLEPDKKGELEAAIQKKINQSLESFDIQISKDTDVPDPEVLGFFIPLPQLKNMIVKSLGAKGSSEDEPDDMESPPRPKMNSPKSPSPNKPPLSPDSDVKDDVEEMINEELLNEMLVRELKQISKVVIKEDFYNFINAGNNVLRTLEENGMERGKKYLEYLVRHNIM